MPLFIDLTGATFGKLLVIKKSTKIGNGNRSVTYWVCKCECGVVKEISIGALRSKATISCGCATRFKPKHNMCFTKEYKSWTCMKRRAMGKEKRYSQYVDKGIDPKWVASFETFFNDMGFAPSASHTIERKDNSKGYFKWNCVWATSKQQNRNYSLNRMIAYNGITLCVTEWSEKLNISRHLIYHRLNRGWDIERTLTTPTPTKKK
jgi:hypothetical protein